MPIQCDIEIFRAHLLKVGGPNMAELFKRPRQAVVASLACGDMRSQHAPPRSGGRPHHFLMQPDKFCIVPSAEWACANLTAIHTDRVVSCHGDQQGGRCKHRLLTPRTASRLRSEATFTAARSFSLMITTEGREQRPLLPFYEQAAYSFTTRTTPICLRTPLALTASIEIHLLRAP